MFKDLIKKITSNEGNNKKKIENLIFLVITLILLIVFINIILKDDSKTQKEEIDHIDNSKTLVKDTEDSSENSLERKLENILTK